MKRVDDSAGGFETILNQVFELGREIRQSEVQHNQADAQGDGKTDRKYI